MKKLALFGAIMVIGAGVALASTLNVPFFNDNPTATKSGFVGVKEASGADQTVTVIYTTVNFSGVPEDQTETFLLQANRSVAFQPTQSTGAENEGNIVPNMTIIGINGVGNPVNPKRTGAITIIGSGALSGRYHEVNAGQGSQFGYLMSS